MDPSTIVSTVGIVASPVLQVALDRLVSYLSKDQSSPSDFEDDLARLPMSNIPALLRAAESTPSPDSGLLDLLRQLKDASHSAEDLLDDLEYLALHLEAQSYTHSHSLPDRTFEYSQPSRARSAPQREAVGGESGQEEAVIAPSFLDVIMAFDWGKAVRALSGGRSDQIPAESSRTAISLPDPHPSSSSSSSTIPTSTDSSSQASQPSPPPPQMQFPKATEHPSSSSTQIKTGLLQQQEMTYRQTIGERIIKTAEKLELIASRLEKSISLEKLANDLIKLPEAQSQHLSSSVVIQHEVFGRVLERRMLVKKLLESDHLEGFSTVLVFGIGGVGKTTLAQCVFNDEEIEEHFELRVWICVSCHFDRLMIVRELVASTSSSSKEQCRFKGLGLDGLERKLKENLEGKRLLLVLDDLWSNEWVKLLPALQFCQAGSKILITAREEKIADRKFQRNKIVLKGLRSDDYWDFFSICAFGDEDAKKHPKLVSIGKQIAEKLQGSPLAAKTMGRLLSENLNDEHWMNILKSNVWDLGEGAGDIMPVLKLSYFHLPPHLQRCFVSCSIFPKDYRYDVDKLVQIWMAQGLILPSQNTRKRPEDIGREYFDDLLSRSFFEQHSSVHWSSKGTYYLMHSLLHDLAYSVSMGECFVYEGREFGRIPRTVRHMSMHQLPELSLVFACKNLHSLLLFFPIPKSFFDVMKSLRVLDLSDVAIDVLPDAVGELKHLRYLDLSRTPLKILPESLGVLYHLQTLILPYACMLPRGTANLINLRHLTAAGEALSNVTDVGRLTSLQELREFHVKLSRGHDIGQLNNMRELGGQLRILNLENVGSKKEALKANLGDKERLIKLQLQWIDLEDGNNWSDVQERVLGGLQPHSNLKALEIKGYMGRHSPTWLAKSSLENLQSIYLIECSRWQRLPPLGHLHFLQVLYMQGMDATLEGSTETMEFFPSLKELWLENTSIIFLGMRSYNCFPCLRKLHIRSCLEVSGLPIEKLSLLQELNISGRIGLDRELPGCLKGLKSLTTLHLSQQGIRQLPLEVMTTLTSLQKLRLKHCPELTSLQGLQGLVSLKNLEILSCPKLSSWMDNGEDAILPARLHSLQIDHCGSLRSLPVLPVGLHSLQITDCISLERWPTKTAGLPTLARLQKIVVERCPKFHRQPMDGRSW